MANAGGVKFHNCMTSRAIEILMIFGILAMRAIDRYTNEPTLNSEVSVGGWSFGGAWKLGGGLQNFSGPLPVNDEYGFGILSSSLAEPSRLVPLLSDLIERGCHTECLLPT